MEVIKSLDKGYKIDGIGVDNFDRYVTHTVNYCYILLYICIVYGMFRLFTVRDITPGAAPFCCCTPILHITLHDIALP